MAIKTRLEDMVIGDKILVTATSLALGAVSSFSNLGSGGGATPASNLTSYGYSASGRDFYFIYTGKDFKGRMILIADRNVQHSISWDALNKDGIATQGGIQKEIGAGANWKTNIRLLTGGTSSTTTANSEWDKYIVNGTGGGQYPAGDNAVWNWGSILSWSSTTLTGNAGFRVVRGINSVSFHSYNATTAMTNQLGFRPVLVAEDLRIPIQTKYLIQDGESVKVFLNNSWSLIGQAPATKEMFDQGMTDTASLTEANLKQLTSDTPKLLCWTDEAEPKRLIKQTVNNWAPVSDTLPTEELFLAEGIDNLAAVTSEQWDLLPGDFDVVTYGSFLESEPAARLNATPHGQLIVAETDFSQIEKLALTGSEGIRVIASGDGGATWKTYANSWKDIALDAATAGASGMTPTAFNALTATQWNEIGSNIRLAYYVEEAGLVDQVVITKASIATETPTLDSIKFTFDEITIEGRMKDLELINAINMAKLQFKTSALMNSTKYELHDMVVDTFESDSMVLIQSDAEVDVLRSFTAPFAMDGGFYSEVSLKDLTAIKGVVR